MRKYPIGLQEFKEVQEGRFVYVDKTQLIHTLIESGNYYFLSRPRRLGKSLLLSTIKEIFNGSKELFKGLCRGLMGKKQRTIHFPYLA